MSYLEDEFGNLVPEFPRTPVFPQMPYSQPVIQLETPETHLAKQEAVLYLKTIKEKLKMDHNQEMARIKSNHEEVMKGMQYSAANNYIAGLTSSDRLKISSVEVEPYLRKGLFGSKSDGIKITIKK